MRSAGIKPFKPDWPLSSTGLSSLSGCAQVVSPQVLAPSLRGSLSTVRHAWTRLGTEDFLGAREECQG